MAQEQSIDGIRDLFSFKKKVKKTKVEAKRTTKKANSPTARKKKTTSVKVSISKLSTSDLVGLVAKKTKQTQKATKETVDTFLATIAKNADSGKKVCLQNFGTFKQVQRKARDITSIADGRKKRIPAHKAVKFTASKNL